MSDFRIFVNFKTYPQGSGEAAKALAEICQQVGEEHGLNITPIVQVVDLCLAKEAVSVPVWVQHIDPQPPGQYTGWTNLKAVIDEGGKGTLINHSEHQLPPGTIKQVMARIKEAKTEGVEFGSMICAKTLGQIERLVKLRPDFIGYEIGELIGGKVSITDSNPKSIANAVGLCADVPLVVGAGIHKAQDLIKAKELGAKGVLVASAVVLADNPKKKLEELIKLII